MHCALFLSEALSALKMRLFHLRHDIAIADHNTSQRNEFLNMGWSKLSDAVDFSEVVGTNLNDLITAKFIVVHHISILVVLAANIVHVELLVNLCDHKIKDWDDVCGIVLDLPVKHLIELEDMVTVNVEDISVKFAHLSKLLNVVWSSLELLIVVIIVIVLNFLKVVDEVFEFHLDFVGIDVCAPEYLRVRACLVGPCHLVRVKHACRGRLIVS